MMLNTSRRREWLALLAAVLATVLVTPTGVAAADSPHSGAGRVPPTAAASHRSRDAAGRIVLVASAGPGGYLDGATLSVTDRRGRSLSGLTNPRGAIRLRLPELMRSQMPLRVSTTGGTVRGAPFGGHLAAYLWPSDLGAISVQADLTTTAAARLLAGRGRSASSQSQWTRAVAKVRKVLGIPGVQATDVLRTRNPFVGAAELERAIASAGSYDRFVARIVRAAAAPHRSILPGLAPPTGTFTVTAPTGNGATDAVCGNASPAVWPDTSFSTGEKALFLGSVAFAGYMGGTKAAAAVGFYVGKALYELGNAGYSPDAAQLSDIASQLDCIATEVQNLTGITETLTSIAKFAPATACANAIDTQWESYEATVNAAIPTTVPVLGNDGSSLYLDPTVAGGLQTGDVVTGTGISQIQGTRTAASFTNESYTVYLAAGSGLFTVLPGMQVTGTGIGTITDGSTTAPAVVRSVTNLPSGQTELVLTAANTASYTGSGKAPTLTFTEDNYIITGGIGPATNPSTGQPATQVSLAGPTSGSVTEISYAYPLTLGNTTTNQTNTASPALSTLVDDWYGATQTCGTAIDDTLFGPTTGTGGPAGYQAFLASILGQQKSTVTQTQVQQIQAMLQWWGLYEVKQLALEQEYANWNDNPSLWNEYTGYADSGADGFPVCSTSTTSATSQSACTGFSHLANAWPDDLYSDEIGQLDKGIAVNGFPGGFVVAGTTNCVGSNCSGNWNVNGGTDTALNPANWLGLYWQLGGNPACQGDKLRYFGPKTDLFAVGSPDGSCKQGPALNSSNWTTIQSTNAVSIDVNESNALSPNGPQNAVGYNATGRTTTGTTGTSCPVGRPFVTAASCQFNVQGFNPQGTSVTVNVVNQAGTGTTSYLLPGLVETWANPKAAHTILPTSGDLGDGTITAVTSALLDGMRCGGLTVTSDGKQGSCIQPASATLQNLSAADVGFFAEDGYVDVGLWWNTNLDAINQQDVVYLNPVTAHYAYCASTTCTQTFPSSEPAESDLYDAPGSCYAQGADRTVTARGIYDSPLFGVGLESSLGIFECPTPVNLSQYSAKRADAFLLGRAWWAGASAWVNFSSPPDPLTATNPPNPPGSPTALSVPAPANSTGAVTAGWSRPLVTSTGTTGGGPILGYVVQATLSDGTTTPCTVAGPKLDTIFPDATGPGGAGSGAAATFATCAPPAGSGLTVTQIQVWAVDSFGNLSAPASWHSAAASLPGP